MLTTSRPGTPGRVVMTFCGLGYHEHQERWLTEEWFWYQANMFTEMMQQITDKDKAKEMLQQRFESVSPYADRNTQHNRGMVFDMLAVLTDDDGALAEMEDLESLDSWLFGIDQLTPPEEPPEIQLEDSRPVPPSTGENLLDQASREKLPPLYSGEELGLEALALAKFFTPDSNWTWYASEFDGDDIFFGLVSGFEEEPGYFSLKEIQEVRGPMGLPIERDLYYLPKSLRELMEKHQKERSSS